MGVFRGGRPLKRWRYVGVFSEELMACAAVIQVGPARQTFWALYSRAEDRLRERTRLLLGRGRVELVPGLPRGEARGRGSEPGRLRVRDAGVVLDLRLEEDDGIRALCPHGREEVWTRKQAGVGARGTLALDGGEPKEIDALAVIDDTAGYHARRTEWWWSAGVGESPEGVALAWNLVAGVNDPPSGSERAVWVAGEPREAAPVSFTADLDQISCVDGSELHFHAEAERSRRENLLVVKSDYRAPFGTFSGTLPGAVALAHGLGVVEHHRALW
ncbi:MAG: DUF2804 domain-containing protein [Solirubrobacterales bacterium]